MDVMRTRYVKRMEKCSVASSEVSGHFTRSNSIALLLLQHSDAKTLKKIFKKVRIYIF